MQRRGRHTVYERFATRAFTLVFILALALLSFACAGGSGSSGFDLAENEAIDMALDGQQCVESDGLTICPAGTATPAAPGRTETPTLIPVPFTPTGTPLPATPTATPTNGAIDAPTGTATIPPAQQTVTATPEATSRPSPRPTRTPRPSQTPEATHTPSPTSTPVGGMTVDTSFDGSEGTSCFPSDTPGVCILPFTFMPQGFSMETHYQVAARSDANTPWELFDALEVSFDAPTSIFGAEIPVSSTTAGPGATATIQTAVLVFVDQTPFLPAMEMIETLAESGADFAYVSPVEQITVGQ